MHTTTWQEARRAADERQRAATISRTRSLVLSAVHYMLAVLDVPPGEPLTLVRESFASLGLDMEIICVMQPLPRKDDAAPSA